MASDVTPAEVAPGVFHVEGSRTNLYLVVEGDEVCVVDSGYPGDRQLVVTAIERIGRSPGDVAAVLLTHAHADHIGSAEWLRATHGARVLTHEAEVAHARGEHEQRIRTLDMVIRIWRPDMFSFTRNVLRSKALSAEHVQEVIGFGEDGQPLDVPGGAIGVFTPGHTSGHCSYHLPDRGVLISGDALVTEDSLTRVEGPRILNRLFNHDHRQAAGSLARLRGLEADVVLPGHGPPFRGSPAEAVALAEAATGQI
jgi:glyoxylase-like metal-dependent hydrolase (beta-lactamase superfamily II)